MTLLEAEFKSGMQQGMQQGMYQVAKNMLLEGEPEYKVCHFTGLSQEIVVKLKKEL